MSEVLFDGLMRQSEIDRLLDEIFGDLEEASYREGEGKVTTLYEEEERGNAGNAELLTA